MFVSHKHTGYYIGCFTLLLIKYNCFLLWRYCSEICHLYQSSYFKFFRTDLLFSFQSTVSCRFIGVIVYFIDLWSSKKTYNVLISWPLRSKYIIFQSKIKDYIQTFTVRFYLIEISFNPILYLWMKSVKCNVAIVFKHGFKTLKSFS